jgi:uncharacterized membrane protein
MERFMEWISSLPNRLLMSQALDALRGRWKAALGVSAVFFLITAGAGSIPGIGTIASLLINGALLLGLARFSLQISRGETARFMMLFDGFKRFRDTVIAYLLIVLFTLLWSLLLIIPGIVAFFSYSQTFFLMADDDRLEPQEAIRLSKEMMMGNRGKLAGLWLRFTGWFIVGFLTMGIGFIWIIPYLSTSLANFYDDLVDPLAPQIAAKTLQPKNLDGKALSDLIIERVMALDRTIKDRESLKADVESTVAALTEVVDLPREEIERIAAEVLYEYRKKA